MRIVPIINFGTDKNNLTSRLETVMRRIKIELNASYSQKKAIDHLGERLLFISDETWYKIPMDVRHKIGQESMFALSEDESSMDEGHLVLKESALCYLGRSGYDVRPESGNIRYLLTDLQENSRRIWSLEKLVKICQISSEEELISKEESNGEDFSSESDYLLDTEEMLNEDADIAEAEEEEEEEDDDDDIPEEEDVCTNCGGIGKIIVNIEGQSMKEVRRIYVFQEAGDKLCPECHGTGRHQGMAE